MVLEMIRSESETIGIVDRSVIKVLTGKLVGTVLVPGDTDYDGRVSKCGDAIMRTAPYEAAQVLLTRTQKWSWLKAWGVQVARRRGGKKAVVALARRLAVILHRMWIDGTEFSWSSEGTAMQTA